MTASQLQKLWLFIRMSRPALLIAGALSYALGYGIAFYLQMPVDPTLFIQGLGLVLFTLLAAIYLTEYYDRYPSVDAARRPWVAGGDPVLRPEGLRRRTALYAGAAALTLAGITASVLIVGGQVRLLPWLVSLLGIFLSVLYVVPPVRLAVSGFGELTFAVLMGGLLPAYGLTLQTGELHALLILSTPPVIALLFASALALELPDFGLNASRNKRSLLIRLGWARAMRLHDFAILFAAGAMLTAVFFGLPGRVALGSLIALPLALAQIWLVARIRRGYPPLWRALSVASVSLVSFVLYFELAGFLLS